MPGQNVRRHRRHRRAHDREGTAGRQGKGEDGRARTREVKLAVFFTQDKWTSAVTRSATGTPLHIATFEPASVFGDLVKAESIRRGAEHR